MATTIKTPANIDALIASGDVVRNTEKNIVSFTNPQTKADVEVTYERNDALTMAGALALCDGDEAFLIKCFNYGFDLKVRAKISAAEKAKYQDPAKKDDRAIANLVATGLFSEAQAREMIESKRAQAGA